jgi:hypothetical protein
MGRAKPAGRRLTTRKRAGTGTAVFFFGQTRALAPAARRCNFPGMKPVILRPALAVLLAMFAGCAPQEPAAPAVPEKSRTELMRSEFFGAEVAADPTVTWRPNGLGVKILTAGEGAVPEPGQRVVVAYTGKLKDGTVFNASPVDKPAEFKLGEMIPGMTAGIALLKPGGRAVLYIPPSLGYGSLRVGRIPPVSGLVFEVELIAVKP